MEKEMMGSTAMVGFSAVYILLKPSDLLSFS